MRSASVQGLSRFASDIIIRGFDTPAKIVDGNFENFNYAGIVTRLLQPILPVFFTVQFAFLYDGWRNEVGLQNVGQALQISFFGLLLLGAFAAVAADAGLLVAFGIESFAGLFESGGIIEGLNSLGAGLDGML